MRTKRNRDDELIEASAHYSISKCGRLARVSTPYKMDKRTKMGIGFDYFDGRYMKFQHRLKKGFNNSPFLSHRMIYYLYTGEIPQFIDHIDNDTRNNAITNLRAATTSQNQMNKSSSKGSSSRFLGVSRIKANQKWQAMINIKGVNKNLGGFTSETEAAHAYNLAAAKHHGEFANLNIIPGNE